MRLSTFFSASELSIGSGPRQTVPVVPVDEAEAVMVSCDGICKSEVDVGSSHVMW